jgi:solute carrier family 25 phosphate transporter 23/24/25/41
MPESAIKFGSFEAMKRVCAKLEGHHNTRKISAPSKIIAGGCAGVISQSVISKIYDWTIAHDE